LKVSQCSANTEWSGNTYAAADRREIGMGNRTGNGNGTGNNGNRNGNRNGTGNRNGNTGNINNGDNTLETGNSGNYFRRHVPGPGSASSGRSAGISNASREALGAGRIEKTNTAALASLARAAAASRNENRNTSQYSSTGSNGSRQYSNPKLIMKDKR
jgi:hypothetical protein